MNPHPSGTVTFFFTDIQGSTQLWEKHPDAMKSALARHDALLRDEIQKNRGYVFKTVGDAFCAAFHTVLDGLNAALAAQRALNAVQWGETPIQVRMALHTGSAEERDGDYFGSALNRVARLLSAGHGGQILLSAVSLELVQGQLPKDVSILDLDEHRLKDLTRPEHVFQLLAPDLSSDFPPLKTLDTLPNNLPIQLTSFIGREKEIEEIKRLLATTRLFTLTGSGGCGKTRLTLEIAADLVAEYRDGVWFIDLAPLTDAALMPNAIASVLGVSEQPNRALIDALTDYLRPKQVILVLDNCEHLIEACAQLSDILLRACPDLRILATSREALNIAGETTFRVPSLSLPDLQNLPPVETLKRFESIQLFMSRATAIEPRFQLSNTNASSIAQICLRLDGMPLAIELAAARVNTLPVGEIATRLDNCFRLLTSGNRTALPRNKTLRASIDWSYNLLPDAERVLLRRLAVFAGSFTLDAVEGICIGEDRYEILDLMSRLVQQSLVVVKLDDQLNYRLLETIRQYAQDKLSDSGEAEQVRVRHLEFFLKLAEEVRPRLRSTEQLKLLNRQRWEYENLRVAIEWACEDASRSRILNSPETGLRVINALDQLGEVYQLLGVGTEAITFYQKAIALCDRIGVADKIMRLRLHGKIVETANSLLWKVNLPRYEAANQIGLASVATLRAELDLENLIPHPEMVRLLTTLSIAAWDNHKSSDWDAAERYARAAIDVAEKLDMPLELSIALRELSRCHFARGLMREGVQIALRQLALSNDPRFKDIPQRVQVLINAGYALETVGEYEPALIHHQQAAILAEQIQAVSPWRMALSESAHCLFRLDRWDEVLGIVDQQRDIQRHYPRERAGPECFILALGAGIHSRRGETVLGAAERAEVHSIMTTIAGPMERWVRAQLH